MNSNQLYLGIDFGGNAVKLGVVDDVGMLLGKSSIPTVPLADKTSCRAFASGIYDFVHELGVYASELDGVGLAVPGIVDEAADDYIFAPNVRVEWALLIDCIAKVFSKPKVEVINDANAAALGEMWQGAGTNAQSALFVTLGSGIGSGLILDGRVVRGGNGAAGEIGHLTVVPDGRPCNCGRKGCLERYASARGIVQSFTEAADMSGIDRSAFTNHVPSSETDALAVFEAMREGDPRAQYALSVFADKLGFALAQVACVADPDVILLGGGLSQGSDLYLGALVASYRSFCLSSCASTEIRCAVLSSDAGVYGAARHAMMSCAEERRARLLEDALFL